MNKDLIIGSLFCEHPACNNNIGYAGALIEEPLFQKHTIMRRLVCLEHLSLYKGWKVLLRWR